MPTLEKEIERKLKNKVESLGGFCLKWVCPGWSGVPDRIVLLPGARVHFIELKRPKGGKLSALQVKWHQWLTRLGFYCFTLWDEEDLENYIFFVEESKL